MCVQAHTCTPAPVFLMAASVSVLALMQACLGLLQA